MLAASPKSPFAEAWKGLVANGYHVLPISPLSKAPSEFRGGRWHPMNSWQKFRSEPASDMLCKLWSQWTDGNIGILTGTPAGAGHVLACIDFDSDDPDTLSELQSSVPLSPVQKRGRRGYSAFYRVAEGTKGFRTPIVELLTDTRQTVVPPSVHPDTGIPYIWSGKQSLFDVAAADLPLLTEDDLERFKDTVESLTEKPFVEQKAQLITFPQGTETIWRRLNNAAYGNLDAWVPALGLYKLRRTAAGYAAVAHWRASSTGRPLEQRACNLSIMRGQGTRDFGDGRSYTALDLVQKALDYDLDQAFTWLSDRLGLSEEPVTLPVKVDVPHDPETGEILESADEVPTEDDSELPDRLTRVPGLLGEVTDWIELSARRPNRTLALGAALTVLGTLMGGAVAGPTDSGTHLYITGIAPSGAGKDHPLQCAMTLLKAANAGGLIGPSEFISMPAVIKFLGRKPVALCAMDEIGAFFGRLSDRNSSAYEKSVSKILRSAWSSSFKSMMTPEWASVASTEILNPSLSIFGVSTADEFFSALEGRDVVNGFLNRFMILSTTVKARDRDPPMSARAVPEELAIKLAKFYQSVHRLTEHDMTAAIGDAKDIKQTVWNGGRAVHQQLLALVQPLEDDPDRKAYYPRTVEMALRLATIRAWGDGRTFISAEDMQWASDLALWSSRCLERLANAYIAENETQRVHNRIVRIVASRGGICSHRELLRTLKGGIKSQDLKGVMDNLLSSGQFVAKKTTPISGGPPTVVYQML